jgi:hypothetical protein
MLAVFIVVGLLSIALPSGESDSGTGQGTTASAVHR